MNGGQFLYTFAYNADGIRTVKTNGSTIHHYTLNGSQIVTETWTTKSSSGAETPNHFLVYLYDENGAPVGLQYRNKTYGTYTLDAYYFEKNLQGDIIAIYTENGTKIGSYTYDAWGNCTVSTESGATTSQKRIVRTLNPFRYRGYYYDTDTGLYYLQSRYYNPQWGRLLNADGYVNANGDLIGFNMYAYCGNNPVNRKDTTGQFWITALIVTAVVVVCAVTLSACSSQPTSDFGAASPYSPSDSTDYNCYAYALGENQWKYVGGSPDAVKDFSVDKVAEMVLMDAQKDGRKMRIIDSYDSPIESNEYRIALRTGEDDYHFMIQHSDGSWSHKPGFCSTRLIDGDNPSVISWDAPQVNTFLLYNFGIVKEIGYVPNYYDSRTVYFAVSK